MKVKPKAVFIKSLHKINSILGDYYCEAINHNSLTGKDIITRSSKFVVDVFGPPAFIQVSTKIYNWPYLTLLLLIDRIRQK